MLRTVTLAAATLATGLMAGLFYAYACSVMPGLSRSDDRTFITAMQRINVAIINGWFLACFLGALVLTALAAALHVGAGLRPALWWILAGLALYVLVLVVTGAINVPLNNAIAAAGEVGRIDDPAAVRAQFEATWIRWNTVRAVLSTASFGCLLWALIQSARLTA